MRIATSAARVAALLLVAIFVANTASVPQETAARSYLGFDCNLYPGDDALPVLRKTFAFTGYWLSPPPGEKKSTWMGKRELLRSQGFGFLVLFLGRDSSELEKAKDPEQLGRNDALKAADAAEKEGFGSDAVIFLDIEEGGRLSPAYHAYIHGWLWNLRSTQGRDYQGGFYCSGIPSKEDAHTQITTAEDIFSHLWEKSRAFVIWAYNDACPPSPGCIYKQDAPLPAKSGISDASVWQFVRSPRVKETARHCQGYAKDGYCYAPGDTGHSWFLDVNSATSPDPSSGAK